MTTLEDIYLSDDELRVGGVLDDDGDLTLSFGSYGRVYLDADDRAKLRERLDAIDGIKHGQLETFSLSRDDSPVADAIKDLADAVRSLSVPKIVNVTNSFTPEATPEMVVAEPKPFGVGEPVGTEDKTDWNLAALEYAVHNSMAVRFTYRKPAVVGRRLAWEPDTKNRFFRPSKVEYVGPEWDRYAVTTGFDIDDEMPKTFRLDRIEGYIVVDESTTQSERSEASALDV